MPKVFNTNIFSDAIKAKMKNHSINMKLNGNNIISFIDKKRENTLVSLPEFYYFEVVDDNLHIMRTKPAVRNFEKIFYTKIVGTYRSLVVNAIEGLVTGYSKNLYVMGSGYRFEYNSSNHVLNVFVGYANTIEIKLDSRVSAELTSNNTELILKSYNKEVVSSTAANIAKIKKPNPYSGSGIHIYNVKKPFVRKEVKKT